VTIHAAKRLAKRLLPPSVVEYIRRARRGRSQATSSRPALSPASPSISSVDIESLEHALWDSDDSDARNELAALAESADAGQMDRLRARLVLSRWHAVRGDYQTALALLESGDPTFGSLEREVASVAADCSLRTGRPQAALAWLAPLVHRRSADASTLVRVGSAKTHIEVPVGHGSGAFIEALNRVYLRDGYALLRRADVSAPADLSNVVGATPRYEPRGNVPRVSVVVIADSATRSLDMTLRSLAAQSWPELEVIVTGDAEESLIQESLSRWTSRVDGFRMTSSADGLRDASGDYVLIHRADEWSHPQRIELMATRLGSVPSSIAVGTHVLEIGPDLLPRWPDVRSARLLSPNALSMMFRRSALRELEDTDLSVDDLSTRAQAAFGVDSLEWLEPDTPLSIFVGEPVDPDRPLAARTARLVSGALQ